jgi:hypothetical protein
MPSEHPHPMGQGEPIRQGEALPAPRAPSNREALSASPTPPHRHAYRAIGYCQHPHARGANTHRVYRCEGCGAMAHSRTPFDSACSPRRIPREQWPPTCCPVSLQQSEVEAWERHYRERAATP